jgi:SAM-dependent methyltransferase
MMDVEAYYRSRFTPAAGRSGVWRAIVHCLRSYVPPDGCVLDLGAGYCFFVNQVAARERHAIDLNEGMPRFAAPGVDAHVGSCEDLGFAQDGHFDVVMASNLFEHLDRAAMNRTLAETWRVIRPGGRLIVIQPNFKYGYKDYFDDYTHVAIYTHVSMCDVLSAAGFTIQRVVPRFLPFSMRSRLPAWPWLVWIYLRCPWRPFAKQMLIVASKGPAARGR